MLTTSCRLEACGRVRFSFQRALEEKEELTAEVKCLKTDLKESKAEPEELRKTVNDMKQVSFSYTVLTPWLLFLCPLLFYAVVF